MSELPGQLSLSDTRICIICGGKFDIMSSAGFAVCDPCAVRHST